MEGSNIVIAKINDIGSLRNFAPSLKAGDTLVLGPGFYQLDTDLYLNNSGLPDAPITIKADAGARPTFSGSGSIKLRGSHWIFEGLAFTEFEGDVFKIGQDKPAVGIWINACDFVKNKGRPITLINCAESEITTCLFRETNTGIEGKGAHAIEPVRFVDKIKVQGNQFQANAADGIQLGGVQGCDIGRFVIENNYFYAPPVEGEGGENAIDIKYISRGPVIIQGNEIVGYRPCRRDGIGHAGGDPGAGIVLHVGAQNVQVLDNIVEDCTNGIRMADQSDQGTPPTHSNLIERNTIIEAVDFPGNEWRPSGIGMGIYLAFLDGSNVVRGNTLAGCNKPIVKNKSQAIVRDNTILDKLPEPEPPNLNDLIARVEAIETNLSEAETELKRIGALVDQFDQAFLTSRVKVNEDDIKRQGERVQAVEETLGAIAADLDRWR